MTDQPLLTTQQVADYLGVPIATIYRWRYVGSGPPAIKVGRHLRVDPVDLADWVDERRDQRATPPARGFGGGGGC
jgi:excisionase family DNA binding protein